MLVANTTEMQLVAQSQRQIDDKINEKEARRHEESQGAIYPQSEQNLKDGSAGSNGQTKAVEESSLAQQKNAI